MFAVGFRFGACMLLSAEDALFSTLVRLAVFASAPVPVFCCWRVLAEAARFCGY